MAISKREKKLYYCDIAERELRSHGMYANMRRVLVLMHTWAGYLHEVQMGVAEYKAQRPEWLCTRMLPVPEITADLHKMKFDGVIAYLEPEYVQTLRDLAIPVVDISNWLPQQGFPRVLPDDVAIGQLAARHLMNLGLKHFAVVGLKDAQFSHLRHKGFVETLAQEGFVAEELPRPCPLTLPESIESPPGIDRSFMAWMLQLPKPLGFFGTFEGIAAEVLEMCRHMDIQVPEAVCVLGVDNDELTATFTHPPLSSIALPTEKIGFEAARLLDRLMAGKRPPTKPICLAPVGVVTRQSTNLLAIPDPDVLAAVRYIREHIHQGITVEDVLSEVPTNRRYLERKFRQHLGRSPLEEIRNMRIAKAKELLSGSDLSMPAVARHSGFPNGERLATVFRQEVGITPTQYRRQFRLHD